MKLGLDKQEILIDRFDTKHGSIVLKKELGKGKSGYSYLADFNNQDVVLKLMHNEPCTYYSFGDTNKVDLEVDAYKELERCGLALPHLKFYDSEQNFLVKEFIDGKTASEVIAEDQISDSVIRQLFEMYHVVKKAGLNIDYFPTNFVIKNQKLFYIDYESNPYSSEWDLPNWGLYYWANSDGFKNYLSTGDSSFINESLGSGIPIKEPFKTKVATWINKHDI